MYGMNNIKFIKGHIFVYRSALFYTTINIIGVKQLWIIKWVGHFVHMGQMKNACKILVGRI
jgi:hypothetical protein